MFHVYFEFLMLLFFFHFHKNGKPNTVRFSFFIFMMELKNELLKQIKINFMIIFTSRIYTLFKSKFVSSPLRFSTLHNHVDIKNLQLRKQLVYFNVYITGCYFQSVGTSNIISRISHSLNIIKVDLKFKQKLEKQIGRILYFSQLPR